MNSRRFSNFLHIEIQIEWGESIGIPFFIVLLNRPFLIIVLLHDINDFIYRKSTKQHWPEILRRINHLETDFLLMIWKMTRWLTVVLLPTWYLWRRFMDKLLLYYGYFCSWQIISPVQTEEKYWYFNYQEGSKHW